MPSDLANSSFKSTNIYELAWFKGVSNDKKPEHHNAALIFFGRR